MRPTPIVPGGGIGPSLPPDLTGTPVTGLFAAGPGGGLSTPLAPGQPGGPVQPGLMLAGSNAAGTAVLAQSDRIAASMAHATGGRAPPFTSSLVALPFRSSLLEAGGSSSPASPSVPAPQTPGGALGAAAGSSTGLFLAGFAVLLLLTAWALPRLARRLDEASALWRPMPFLTLLERPG